MSKVLTREIYNANLEPIQGSEQGKTRPIVVFQNPDLARFTSTALCIPLTSNLNAWPARHMFVRQGDVPFAGQCGWSFKCGRLTPPARFAHRTHILVAS